MWSGRAVTLAEDPALTEAADAPRCAARSAAAASTTATPATAAATATATTTATAAATPRNLHTVAGIFLVKKMERRQADVGDFFVAKRHRLRRRKVQFLRGVHGRNGRCRSTPRQRKS